MAAERAAKKYEKCEFSGWQRKDSNLNEFPL